MRALLALAIAAAACGPATSLPAPDGQWSTNPSAGGQAPLYPVAGMSADDLWTFQGGHGRPTLHHWDGGEWSAVAMPEAVANGQFGAGVWQVLDIAAAGDEAVWLAYAPGGLTTRCVLLRVKADGAAEDFSDRLREASGACHGFVLREEGGQVWAVARGQNETRIYRLEDAGPVLLPEVAKLADVLVATSATDAWGAVDGRLAHLAGDRWEPTDIRVGDYRVTWAVASGADDVWVSLDPRVQYPESYWSDPSADWTLRYGHYDGTEWMRVDLPVLEPDETPGREVSGCALGDSTGPKYRVAGLFPRGKDDLAIVYEVKTDNASGGFDVSWAGRRWDGSGFSDLKSLRQMDDGTMTLPTELRWTWLRDGTVVARTYESSNDTSGDKYAAVVLLFDPDDLAP